MQSFGGGISYPCHSLGRTVRRVCHKNPVNDPSEDLRIEGDACMLIHSAPQFVRSLRSRASWILCLKCCHHRPVRLRVQLVSHVDVFCTGVVVVTMIFMVKLIVSSSNRLSAKTRHAIRRGVACGCAGDAWIYRQWQLGRKSWTLQECMPFRSPLR